MKILFTWCWLFVFSFNLYAYTKGKLYQLTILHTNDHHGRFWPNRSGEFGLAARATLLTQLRKEIKDAGGHVLLLDAGDVNTGVPQSDMLDAEPDFKGMALLGYDVMAVGNHEFDKPLATIFQQREWGGFPFISANIYYQSNQQRVFPSHIQKELDDLKVTIFGLTTEDTPLKSNPLNSKGLVFKPTVAEATSLVPTLRPHTDVLIALTHMGHYADEHHGADAPGDVTLARKVNGIDLIVGGHTEKPLFQPDIQNGTIIVQAQNWGMYVGRVDLEFLDGKISLKKYELIPVNLKDAPNRITPDAYVEAFLRPFKEKGDATLMVELGKAEVEFIGRREVVRLQETNLGNLISSAYQQKFNADLALLNSGGLRDSLYSGSVTYESVLTVLPFGGEVVTAEVSGQELKKYLEYVIFNFLPGSGSFPQMSGVTIKANASHKKITELKVGGRKLCPTKKYLIALPEFIAGGGDKYPALSYRKHGHIDAEIVKDFMLKQKTLRASDFAPTGYLQLQ
jgi:5'-nucleotidase / UDP-sugar diphosphatase